MEVGKTRDCTTTLNRSDDNLVKGDSKPHIGNKHCLDNNFSSGNIDNDHYLQMTRPRKSPRGMMIYCLSPEKKLASSPPSSSPSPPTPESPCDSPFDDYQYRSPVGKHSEIKSGTLVMIFSDQNGNSPSLTPKFQQRNANSPTAPQRCPVLVKVYKKSYENYAIISGTRRQQQSMPPLYLKLKNSFVIQSTSDQTHFNVVVDGTEGKTFRFEAISPEAAQEWILAFSCEVSCPSPVLKSGYFRRLNREPGSPLVLTPPSPNEEVSAPTHRSFSETLVASPTNRRLRSLLMPVLSESTVEDGV